MLHSIPVRLQRLVSLLTVGLLGTGVTHSQTLHVPIEPQPLADALEKFANVTNLQLIYRASLGTGVMSQGAEPGTAAEALQQILRETGLTFAYVNDRTVTIVTDEEALTVDTERSGTEQTVTAGTRSSSHGVRDKPEVPYWDDLKGVGAIIVTGTHISGHEPVGASVTSLTRRQITQSGAATTEDIVRSLPMNTSRGPAEDTQLAGHHGLENLFNSSFGSGFNLRGLGSGSTLVLLNGRRFAPGGGDGRFVDVSTIPLVALERIEVLPDGASAIYGADALGGVVNFILRDRPSVETTARLGSGTLSGPGERQVAQSFGGQWDSGRGFLSAEYYARDALPAADRRQAADSDLRPFGGDNWSGLEGNPGTIAASGTTWAIPYGQDGRSLNPDQLVAGTSNLHNENSGRDLYSEYQRLSLAGTLRHDFGESVHGFVDLLASTRKSLARNPASGDRVIVVPPTNPFYVNPAGGSEPVAVFYNFARDLGAENDRIAATNNNLTVGVTTAVGTSWEMTAYGTYAHSGYRTEVYPFVDTVALNDALIDENPVTAFNPFGDGSYTNQDTLDSIRSSGLIESDSHILMGSLNVRGTLLERSGRSIHLAAGVDFRHQSLDSFALQASDILQDRGLRRDVSALYAELMVPLIERHRFLGVDRLELSLAARREEYSDFGAATTPRIGLVWSPSPTISVRSTWSQSFKAPDLANLDERDSGLVIDLQEDSSSSSGVSPVLLWFGSSADLEEEASTAWTLGLDYKPSPQFSAALNHFHLTLRDRVDRIDYTPTFLSDLTYSDLVTRSPTLAQRENVCVRGRMLGSVNDCLHAPVAAIVDMRLRNTASIRTTGFDLTASHESSTRLGTWIARLYATYLTDYSRAQFRSRPSLSLLDTPGYPLNLRVRGSMHWDYRGVGVSSSFNYADDYTDTVSAPRRPIDAWTTVDLQLRYTKSPGREGTVFSLNIQNAFDADPPFYNNSAGIGYDPEHADVLGRMVSAQFIREW